MTGIKGAKDEKYEDSTNAHQENKIISVRKQGIIQVGLTCFIPCHQGSTKNQEAHSFNFWVSPFEQLDGELPEVTFEHSAISFLNKSADPDWNNFIKDGIPYCKRNHWRKHSDRKEAVITLRTSAQPQAAPKLNDEESTKFARLKDSIISFLAEQNDVQGKSFHEVVDNNNNVSLNVQKHLANWVKEHHQGRAYLRIKEEDYEVENFSNVVLILFETRAGFEGQLRELRQKLEAHFLRQVGFTEVFQNLLNSKKVLIGHNCFCDLVFLFQHFNDNLPADLIAFKQVVNNTLINVQDTKRIHDHPKLSDLFPENLGLSELYSRITAEPDIFNAPVITEVGSHAGVFHNAAFDSMATGVVFLKLKQQWSAHLDDLFVKIFKNMIQLNRSLQQMNMSSNEDELKFVDKSALLQVKTDHKEKKRLTYNRVKELLKLEDDFQVKFNGDDDFFLYLGHKERDLPKINNIVNNKWSIIKFEDWEIQQKLQQNKK